jgi:hypothetical protein
MFVFRKRFAVRLVEQQQAVLAISCFATRAVAGAAPGFLLPRAAVSVWLFAEAGCRKATLRS